MSAENEEALPARSATRWESSGRVRHRRSGRARSHVAAQAIRRAAIRPWSSAPAFVRYGAGLGLVGGALGARLVGIRLPDLAHTDPKDHGTATRAWDDNLLFHTLLESYLLTERLLRELVHAARLEDPAAPKAAFAGSASCPTRWPPPPTSCSRTRRRWCGHSRRPVAACCAAPATSSTTWSRTRVGRARSTAGPPRGRKPRGHARQGGVPQRIDRSAPVRATNRGRCARSRSSCVPRGSTATTSQISHRARAWSNGQSNAVTPCSRSATATPTSRCATSRSTTICGSARCLRSTSCARSARAKR